MSTILTFDALWDSFLSRFEIQSKYRDNALAIQLNQLSPLITIAFLGKAFERQAHWDHCFI